MDVGAQPVSRLRGFSLSEAAVRRLVLANAVALVLIVATGATVRLTGSGLGCEHWPGCTPHHFEPKSGHSYIEFGNRVIAFLTILTTLATWIFARGRRRLAALIFFGTLAQAPLGALTVHYHLNPWLVLSHFLLSMVVLALAVALVPVAPAGEEHVPAGRRWTGLLVGLAACVLLSPGRLRPPPARTRAARSCAVCGRSSPRCTGTCVRRRCSGSLSRSCSSSSTRTRPQVRAGLVVLGASRGADDDRRGPVPTHLPGGSCSCM